MSTLLTYELAKVQLIRKIQADRLGDRVLQTLDHLLDLMIPKVKEPGLHIPRIDHGRYKPGDPDEPANVEVVNELDQYLGGALVGKRAFPLGVEG